jgi:ubiquinone/menaquinone biosynthesis C-methylase UbiE
MYRLYSEQLLPRFLDRVMGKEPFTAYRQELLQAVAGDVLELGFGTGLNLPHYSEQVTSLAIVDPNRGMHHLARKRLQSITIPVRTVIASGEALPFDEQQFDCVVSTWTLCSIPQVDQAIAEVYRVLKPGGQFFFIEHGLSEELHLQRWQRWLTPIQKMIGDGCHLDRDMQGLIQGKFSQLTLKTFYAPDLPKLGGYFYQGRAFKP